MTINTKRLALLAYYLPSIPVDRFAISGWRHCSIGWATQIPEFVKLGFKLVDSGGIGIIPSYRGELNWYAVEKFFGLTDNEAQNLFSMFCYPQGGNTTPKQVAARIKEFLNGKRDF